MLKVSVNNIFCFVTACSCLPRSHVAILGVVGAALNLSVLLVVAERFFAVCSNFLAVILYLSFSSASFDWLIVTLLVASLN